MRQKSSVAVLTALVACLSGAQVAAARVVQAGSVLPPGQSGFVPPAGDNPHLFDQIGLFTSFGLKPAALNGPGTPETPRPGVTILRDAAGVPDVRARSDRDAWWGAGHAVAQDRLVELELFRRQTRGTLAALLGPDRLDADIVNRRDYYSDAELRAQLARLAPALRARFDSYAAGVNAWIARIKANPALVPGEIGLLKLSLEPWTALDSARIGVQLARTVPASDGAELRNLRLLKTVGARRFDALLPLRSPHPVTTVPRADGLFPSRPGRTRRDERAGFAASRRLARSLPLATAGASAAHGGSNAYAIRTPKGAILNSSPQVGFSVPELFVELEVHAPGLDVRGVTAPGIPVMGIGHNGRIAWGITSGLSDDNDLYAEALAGSSERYRFKGRVRRMRCRTERFAVAGARRVSRRLCRTLHGPVQARAGRIAYARRYSIWGRELATFEGIERLNRAGSVREAERAVSKLTWNENTLVADSRGNIGWWHPGRLPLRPRRWDERLPYPGTGEAEWRGFLRFSQLPQVVNPKRGWIANWNNLPSAGWTNGDAEAGERLGGPLHRAALLEREVARAEAAGTWEAMRAVDRVVGTTAQQRPLVDARLRAAAAGATGQAKALLDAVVAWDGNYDRADAAGAVDPGVAAFEALKAALATRAIAPLGGAGARPLADSGASKSHQFDATYGETLGLRLGAKDYRAAAAVAAAALQARFGSPSPAAWREARRSYDVAVQGIAPKPYLPFFDRGTWQQTVELAP